MEPGGQPRAEPEEETGAEPAVEPAAESEAAAAAGTISTVSDSAAAGLSLENSFRYLSSEVREPMFSSGPIMAMAVAKNTSACARDKTVMPNQKIPNLKKKWRLKA